MTDQWESLDLDHEDEPVASPDLVAMQMRTDTWQGNDDDREKLACDQCGRLTTDWDDAPALEGGQSVGPWCEPCLRAWARGNKIGHQTAARQGTRLDDYLDPSQVAELSGDEGKGR